MAEGEKLGETDQKVFDRYEVVAVALPGAAFLLFMSYFRPDLVGAETLKVKDITLGALGIFAIAAMIAGQLLQGFGNVIELVLNELGDWFRRSPISMLPVHDRALIIAALESRGIDDPGSGDRKRFRREMHGTILSATRRAGTGRFSDVYNTTYGLNRGLAVASLLAIGVAVYDQKWLPAAILFLILASTVFRAARANLRFERDMLRTFANLT